VTKASLMTHVSHFRERLMVSNLHAGHITNGTMSLNCLQLIETPV